jgi:hypothetical protein
MKTLKRAVVLTLAAVLGSAVGWPLAGSVAEASRTIVNETLGENGSADLYEVICSNAQFLVVATHQDGAVADFHIVSGFRTSPVPALGGEDDAAVELIGPGQSSELVFGLPKNGTVKALVSVTSGPATSPMRYQLEGVCFRNLGSTAAEVAPVIKLKQDE